MKETTKVVLAMLAAVLVVAAVPVGFFVFYAAASIGSNSGWPKLAAVWAITLRKYETPEDAAARIPDLVVPKIEDGQ